MSASVGDAAGDSDAARQDQVRTRRPPGCFGPARRGCFGQPAAPRHIQSKDEIDRRMLCNKRFVFFEIFCRIVMDTFLTNSVSETGIVTAMSTSISSAYL